MLGSPNCKINCRACNSVILSPSLFGGSWSAIARTARGRWLEEERASGGLCLLALKTRGVSETTAKSAEFG